MYGLGITIHLSDIEEVKDAVKQLQDENSNLKLQLELLLKALGDPDTDTFCPSVVNLPESTECASFLADCGKCWREALNAVRSD